MCHGHIDPKFALREAEGRLQGVATLAEGMKKDDAARPTLGAAGWLRAALARLMRKDEAHV